MLTIPKSIVLIIMYQCNVCTAASGVCSRPRTLCSKCNLVHVHTCQDCLSTSGSQEVGSQCYLCNYEEGKLNQGVRCSNRACHGKIVRRQLQKINENFGRYFYSCAKCGKFTWDPESKQRKAYERIGNDNSTHDRAQLEIKIDWMKEVNEGDKYYPAGRDTYAKFYDSVEDKEYCVR